MRVLAISGKKKSGKDTAANFLVREKGFVRLGFADILKDMASELYDVPRSWFDDSEYKEAPIVKYPVITKDDSAQLIHNWLDPEFKELNGTLYWTPRALAIMLGSVSRAVDSGYWVHRVINQIAFDPNNAEKNFVISDVRYKSELELLNAFFGKSLITMRLNRFEETSSKDPSECDLDSSVFDIVIRNSEKAGVSKEDLYSMVSQGLEQYGL